MTALSADRLREMIDEANDQQEALREAWVELSRIHDEFYDGRDSHIRAYVLDHLRILISDDHGFVSRDSSVDTFIHELEEAQEEAEAREAGPKTCGICEVVNTTDELWPFDLCPDCAKNDLYHVDLTDNRKLTLFRQPNDRIECYFWGWTLWQRIDNVTLQGEAWIPVQSSKPYWIDHPTALEAGCRWVLENDLIHLHPKGPYLGREYTVTLVDPEMSGGEKVEDAP